MSHLSFLSWSNIKKMWIKAAWWEKVIFLFFVLPLTVPVIILFLISPFGFTLSHNQTQSVPYWLVLLHRDHLPVRDELVIFRNSRQPCYNSRTQFVKYTRGLPGDRLQIIDQKVFVNGRFIAQADVKDCKGILPEPLSFNGIIPPHKYLAMGSSRDSYDSRYASFGLIDEDQIMGTGIPLVPF